MTEFMEKFCGSEFWNTTISWYTPDPDLPKCFEKTVLVWVPCLFLWVFSILEFYYILNSKTRDIPWSWINISKLLVNLILILLALIDLVLGTKTGHSVDIFTPIVKILSFALIAALIIYNKRYGLKISGLQFLFWLTMALCGAVQFRTEIRDRKPKNVYSDFSYLIYYPVVLIMLALNFFADKSPRDSKSIKVNNPSPEEESGFPARLTFSWFDPMVWKGFKKPLVFTDLWDMRVIDSSAEIVPAFEKNYYRKQHHQATSYKADSSHIEFSRKKKEKSILPAMLKTFGTTFLFGVILDIIQNLLIFVNPKILNLLIQFAQKNEEQWKGYFYAALLVGAAIIQILISNQYNNRMYLIGMRIRTALVSVIYKKSLRISNKTRKERTVGEMVNLISVDAQRFVHLTGYLNTIWSAPLQIVLALYFLWNILGVSIFAGMVVLILLIPINGYIAKKSKVLHLKLMKKKDERVKLMNEVLSGIKILKLYAWEPSFQNQILKIRAKEIQILKQNAYLHSGMSFIWLCAPFVVSLVTFATYVTIDKANVLDASTAFVSISLFNILSVPLTLLPMVITSLIQTMVSIQRINKFMNSDELEADVVTHKPTEKYPLTIENGTFSWDDEPVLKNINVELEKGTLSAIVGSVGSGKSSLVNAFLGEMNKVSGRVNTNGSIAYVAQQAWIQNATLRENILFGKSFSNSRYDKVIEACALKPDFEMLVDGDQTEIGEKGINLSGGQKQRVSLARAVYANSEVYFLDDPLSAVDSHVGKHIFDKVIGPDGLLKNKTRVLVTHGITYLPQTDKIVVLKDGEISENGTYQELLRRKGAFSDFLMQHINEVEEDEEELSVLKEQLSGTMMSDTINRKLSRHASRVSESSELNTKPSYNKQKSVDSTVSSILHQSINSLNKMKKPEANKLIEVEKTETGGVKWGVYKYYFMSLGLIIMISVLLLNLIHQGFGVGSNLWLSVWTDDPELKTVNGTVNSGLRDFYLSIYGVLGIGQAFAIMTLMLTFYTGTLNGARRLHEILLANVLRLPCPTFFDVTPVGRILNRFAKDIDVVDSMLPMMIRHWLGCLISVIGTLSIISYTTPLFISVIIPMAILYSIVQRFYVATSRQLKRIESVSRSPIYSHFGESITGAQAIRAYREQDRFIKDSELKVDANQVCCYLTNVSDRWLGIRLEMLGNLLILCAVMFTVHAKDLNPGLVGLSITYALQITHNLNWLVRSSSNVENNIVAVERIKEYGEVVQESAWELPVKDPPASWPRAGTLQFQNFGLRYRPGLDLVLKNLNICINGGEKIGIVGRTGAGKSSLTLGLFRIIEAAAGEIFIDGINIASLGLHTLRSRLTIIPQDAVLFSGSLRMNLDPFDKHSDEDLWQALELSHLKQFVKGLPSGLTHEVTEGGENLSAGQRQLICLTRALLRKTKILILDEATAAVDLETDDLIQKTIKNEFHECTILTIAHRLNTIIDSDKIVVLDKGKIAEFDSPSNLLEQQNSIFYSMCKDAGLI